MVMIDSANKPHQTQPFIPQLASLSLLHFPSIIQQERESKAGLSSPGQRKEMEQRWWSGNQQS